MISLKPEYNMVKNNDFIHFEKKLCWLILLKRIKKLYGSYSLCLINRFILFFKQKTTTHYLIHKVLRRQLYLKHNGLKTVHVSNKIVYTQ